MRKTRDAGRAVVNYAVIKPEIYGNVDDWRIAYDSDLEKFGTLALAVSHGWEIYGHDDWLIGRFHGDTLVKLSWMDEERDDPDEVRHAAEAIGVPYRLTLFEEK